MLMNKFSGVMSERIEEALFEKERFLETVQAAFEKRKAK